MNMLCIKWAFKTECCTCNDCKEEEEWVTASKGYIKPLDWAPSQKCSCRTKTWRKNDGWRLDQVPTLWQGMFDSNLSYKTWLLLPLLHERIRTGGLYRWFVKDAATKWISERTHGPRKSSLAHGLNFGFVQSVVKRLSTKIPLRKDKMHRIYVCPNCYHRRIESVAGRPKCPLCRKPPYAVKMNVEAWLW